MIPFLEGPAPFLNSITLMSCIGESINRASIFRGDHLHTKESGEDSTHSDLEGLEEVYTEEANSSEFSSTVSHMKGGIFLIVSLYTLPIFAQISMIFHMLYFAKDTITYLLEKRNFPPVSRSIAHASLLILDGVAFKFSSAISFLMVFVNSEILPNQVSSLQSKIQAYGNLDEKDFKITVGNLPSLFYGKV